MYSATFAMTVIIGIAVTNLFLGFAAAVLMGRGPKRWSDIDRAIVLQPIYLGRLRPARRPVVERVDLKLAQAWAPQEAAPEPPVEQPAGKDPAEQPTAVTIAGSDVELLAAAPAPAPPANVEEPAAPAPKKFTLPPRKPVDEHEPSEKVLSQQLDSWRHGELSDETPSMSGMQIELEGCELDDATRELLAEAVHARIKGQVRKDRRVLRIGSGRFAWFSCDVPPDDALMPVERIRQMLTKTQFHHQGNPITITVVAGVVMSLPEDDADSLLERLHATFQYALEKKEHATYLDTGQGPEGIEPYPIEVEQTECELAEPVAPDPTIRP